eukprot:4733220-Prymnesium_polylepis.1
MATCHTSAESVSAYVPHLPRAAQHARARARGVVKRAGQRQRRRRDGAAGAWGLGRPSQQAEGGRRARGWIVFGGGVPEARVDSGRT